VHVPLLTRVTVVPETVQTLVVPLLKVTAKPLDAVPLTLKAEEPKVLSGIDEKVIAWLIL
jgi:hypothetical protein